MPPSWPDGIHFPSLPTWYGTDLRLNLSRKHLNASHPSEDTMNFRDLLKSKTFWTAITGILGTLGGYMQGAVSLKEAAFAILGSLMAIFIKDAMVSATKS